jgi:hypothetical protein
MNVWQYAITSLGPIFPPITPLCSFYQSSTFYCSANTKMTKASDAGLIPLIKGIHAGSACYTPDGDR